MSTHRPKDREGDLSPLERYIRQEDSRRAIARVRRLATELAQQSIARGDAGAAAQVQVTSSWLMLRRAAAWVRQLLATPRTGTPPS
jgi:hypothetical protein